MSVPGSNLLKQALTVIASTQVAYYKYISRIETNIGTYVSNFADPILIRGSLQPVPKNLYTQFGLDLTKSYYTFYALKEIMDVGRNVSGDIIAYLNNQYQCMSANDWFPIDGWVGVLVVLISPDNQYVFGLGPQNKNFNNGDFANEN